MGCRYVELGEIAEKKLVESLDYPEGSFHLALMAVYDKHDWSLRMNLSKVSMTGFISRTVERPYAEEI